MKLPDNEINKHKQKRLSNEIDKMHIYKQNINGVQGNQPNVYVVKKT